MNEWHGVLRVAPSGISERGNAQAQAKKAGEVLPRSEDALHPLLEWHERVFGYALEGSVVFGCVGEADADGEARAGRRRHDGTVAAPARPITGGLVPGAVTRAVKRISARAGVPISWTGHSLRIGLVSTGRKKGKDAIAIAIADQGGWARHSRSMQREDGWDDNASAGLT
ncbi:hypothetical protein [Streptomyces sp. NPDC023588]|uniref:hypothetical protein n=1 Tax=Streptomyces sp. NPDC023588 TaxID=3154907 RepID=UPI0033E2C6B0